MQITVTEGHIKDGIRYNPCKCPIALALRDDGYHEIQVDKYGIHFQEDERGAPSHFLPSKDALKFIMDFDEGLEVVPMTLILEPRPA